MSNSDHYTQQLKGKTIESVDHRYYGISRINFTDGTCARLDPSGTPATVFITLAQPLEPLLARVFKSESKGD